MKNMGAWASIMYVLTYLNLYYFTKSRDYLKFEITKYVRVCREAFSTKMSMGLAEEDAFTTTIASRMTYPVFPPLVLYAHKFVIL